MENKDQGNMYQLKYHHIGIPTKKELPESDYIPGLKCYASGFTESHYGIEWMKFDDDCVLPDLVKNVPHIAFVTDNLQEAIKDKDILIEPNSPSVGTTVAFIVENGAPVEIMQFDNPESEIWSDYAKYKFPPDHAD
jgi:hypothetical protein